MHDITARAPRRRRWISEWWLWPLAMLTLGCALMLGAHAWSLDDEQHKQPLPAAPRDLDASPSPEPAAAAPSLATRGRALVEPRSAHEQQGDASTALAQWYAIALEP